MGQLSKDSISIQNGKLFFIPSGSVTLGVSQSVNSVAQHYAVTMSGASLSQSVLAPAAATASFWHFRSPDTHSLKVFYQNDNRTSVEPTGSIFGLRDLPNVISNTVSGSVIRVVLPMGISGSEITSRTIAALQSSRFGINRYTISASGHFTTSFGQDVHPDSGSGFHTYIHIINSITGTPIADDINFSYISGSSISYCVQTSGSGTLRGVASEGTPSTGSATVEFKLNETQKTRLDTNVQDSASFINMQNGFYGISMTNATTGSNVSLHGGLPIDIGQKLPNAAYIKTPGSFDILLDNDNSSTIETFRVWTNTGVAGVGGTELLNLDESGNLQVLGDISSSGFIYGAVVDGGSF